MENVGYFIRLNGRDEQLHSGSKAYWSIEFKNLIKGLNASKAVDETIFPEPVLDKDGVRYLIVDENGNEILKHSISLRERAVPKKCLQKLVDAVEQLHQWAEDPRVPQENREFCKKFCLPDPRVNPSAYRMTGGVFSRKLHVLWGYQKEGSKAFLPLTKVSEKWDDAKERGDIFRMCQGSLLRRIFRVQNVVAFALVAVVVYFGLFFPVMCPRHNCEVGKGVYNLFGREARCPKRCALPGCNRHLDEKEKCYAHKCIKCGRRMPTSNEQNGKCDECFWILK